MKNRNLFQGNQVIMFATILLTAASEPYASALQSKCSFMASTVTCTGTIPRVVPTETTEVVLLAPIEFRANDFCSVTWPNVRTLALVYLRFRAYLFDHLFDCLGQINTLKVNGSIWFVSSNAFYGLENVTTLDMSDSSIDSKQLSKLFSLQTTVKKLTSLIISNNGVSLDKNQRLISAISPRPIKFLDVSKTDVTFNFHNSSQLYKTLTSLNLRGSSVTVKHLPRLCPSLKLTDLSENLNLTRSLKLCKKSTSLKVPSFYSVKVMVLNHILLEDAPACSVTFYHSKLIRELHFTYNHIQIFNIWFDFPFFMTKLDYIRLSHNNISDIDKGALSLLPTVKRVDLSFNNLHKMKDLEGTMSYLFQRNLYMSSIDLASNGLAFIPDKSFALNSKLQEIRLSNNAFEQLSLNFSQMSNLQTLDLRFNKIQYLNMTSQNKVEEFYKMHTKGSNRTIEQFKILLEGNPFTCDCVALQFLRWFQTSPIFNASYTCLSNGAKYHMTDAAVKAAEDNCERPKRKLRTILLSTTIPSSCVIGTVLVAFVLYKRRKKQKLTSTLNEKFRLIREERTGYKFLVFLSFSDVDAQFVTDNIYHQLQEQLVSVTGCHRNHVVHPEVDFTPGHSIFCDAERLIADSGVFVAVVSNNYCTNYFSQLEISEARTTGKPILRLV